MKYRARWIALAVGVVVVAFGVLLAVQHRDEPSVPRLVQEHGPVPNFALTTLDGKKINTASLRGKTYVVNFFNSWCIPCQKETPALKAFYAAHKNDPDFAMVGIVEDDEENAIRGFVDTQQIGWSIAIGGSQQAALDFGTTGQPETYVISPDGVAVCGTLGPSNKQLLDKWVEAARNGQQCV